MDVDTPSGTNSGAGKKRFEVKKVRPRRRAPPAAPGGMGRAGVGLMPASGTEEGATSRSPDGAGRPVPHRGGGRGGARPAGSPGVRPGQWLRRAAARAERAGQSAGAAGGGGSRSRSRGLRRGRAGRGMPWLGLRRSLPSGTAAPTGLGYSVPWASEQLGPGSSAGVLPPPHHPRPLWPSRPGCPMCCVKCFLQMSLADFFSPSYLNRAITTC